MIRYENGSFLLSTPNTSYVMQVNRDGYLGHLYYGKRLDRPLVQDFLRSEEIPSPSVKPGEKVSFLDNFPFEYPASGVGDFRENCLEISDSEQVFGFEPLYKGYIIKKGKPALKDLPASFGHDCETLIITLEDNVRGVELDLGYCVFNDCDMITRWNVVKNLSEKDIYLEKALTLCMDMELEGFSVIRETGVWAREHQAFFTQIQPGVVATESSRGESGHEAAPFIGLVSSNATNETGEAYGFSFVWSGSFLGKVWTNSFGLSRLVMGVNPNNFRWKLKAGDEFTMPEVIMTYSSEGLGKMSRNFHDFIREHIIRSVWKDRQRPVLVNNWEATYLDFDDKKLIEILRTASKAGLDMLVIDDGWFRESKVEPEGGLGDWVPVKSKFPDGFTPVVEEAKKLNIKLGLWFEPEMISIDSDLYRAHPEYALSFPGRVPALCRNQLMLDFSNPDVLDTIYEKIATQIRESHFSYIKWDMNRPICDAYSRYLPADQQGEIFFRHVLGVYKIQEKLLMEFPELLIENCSSGGARFDCGMLYYSPQIWTSDDMDPVERLSICEGTELIYPVSTMGAHVCKNQNDISGRLVSFDTRGLMAIAGTFGYELDISKLSEEDLKKMPAQIRLRRELDKLINRGEYYRLSSFDRRGYRIPGSIAKSYDCMEIVSRDGSEAAVWYMKPLYEPDSRGSRIKLKGLVCSADYDVTVITDADSYFNPDTALLNKRAISGEELMNAGLCLPVIHGDYTGVLILIR